MYSLKRETSQGSLIIVNLISKEHNVLYNSKDKKSQNVINIKHMQHNCYNNKVNDLYGHQIQTAAAILSLRTKQFSLNPIVLG